MTEELSPCPFCGGEADVHYFAHDDSECTVMCSNPNCRASVSARSCGSMTAAYNRARKLWNRRAERTARVKEDTKRASQTQLVVTKSCSECGHCFGAETHYERMFEGMVLNEIELPSYCPNCGARVIEEES